MSQRQFRLDDSSLWAEQYGDGSDGDNVVTVNGTHAPVDSACTGTAGNNSLSATNVSFAANQIILIHQTQGSGAGNWELNVIQSYVAGTITTRYPLINNYVSGAQVIKLDKNLNFTVNSGVTLTGKSWTGSVGGILPILALENIDIVGALSVDYIGFDGGAQTGGSGWQGNSSVANGTTSTSANGSAGGGGHEGDGAAAGGGGGAGNSGSGGVGETTSRPGGAGGSSVGNSDLTVMVLSAGGGSGGARSGGGSGGGKGGDGGGLVFLIAKKVTITGNINGRGQNGTNGSGGFSHGAGGGGAGANVLIKGEEVTIGTNQVLLSGGSGGAGASSGGDGGPGSAGRLNVDYARSFSGSASAASVNSRQDSSLYTKNGGAIVFALLNS